MVENQLWGMGSWFGMTLDDVRKLSEMGRSNALDLELNSP